MDQSLVHPNRVRQPTTVSFRLPPSQLCRHYTQHVGRALCLEHTRLTRCKLKNSTESTTNVDCQFGSRSLQTLRRYNNCLHVAKNLLSGRHRLPQWHDFAQADTCPPCRGMQKTKRGSGPRGAPRAVFFHISFQIVNRGGGRGSALNAEGGGHRA